MSIEKITPQIAGMYLGQKCDVEWQLPYHDDSSWNDIEIDHAVIERLSSGDIEITPHLRSPDTLTEQECQMLYYLETGEAWTDQYGDEENTPSCIRFWFHDEYKGPTGSPMVWLKMLEMGFDLFGLIPAGLAKEIGDGK